MFLTEYSVITVPFSDAFYRVLLRFFFSLNPWLTSPFFQVTMISSLASFVDPLFARSTPTGWEGGFRVASRNSRSMIRFPGRKPPRQHRRRLRPTWRNRVTRWEATLTPSELGISLVYRARCALTVCVCVCVRVAVHTGHDRQTWWTSKINLSFSPRNCLHLFYPRSKVIPRYSSSNSPSLLR